MARNFTAASSQYLSTTTLPVASVTYPLTMSCWFWVNDVTTTYTVMGLANSGSVNTRIGIVSAGAVAGDPLRANAVNNAGTSGNADSSTSVTANVWHHACAVYTSAADRSIQLNAGGKISNTTNLVTAWDTFSIAARNNSTPTGFLDGRVAWASIHDVALTDAEITRLAQGFHPALVQPNGLVSFHPLYGLNSPEPNQWRTGGALTLTGTPAQAAQPNLFLIGRPMLYVPTAVAAATFAPTMTMMGVGS